MDDEDDSASRSEQKTIIPHKKPVRIKDDWTEIIIEAIKEHENQEGRTGTKAQIWSRLYDHPPTEYQYKWKSQKKAFLMQGNPPLSRGSFDKRFDRLYPGDKPR